MIYAYSGKHEIIYRRLRKQSTFYTDYENILNEMDKNQLWISLLISKDESILKKCAQDQ